MNSLQQYKSIAIIQTAFIGDAALALYLAQEIKQLNPLCKVHFVCTPISAPLVHCASAVDTVIPYDKRKAQSGWKGIKAIAKQLRALQTDCVLGLQRSIRTTLIAKICGATTTVGFTNSALSWLYKHRVEWKTGIHETQRNKQMLTALGCELSSTLPKVQCTLPEVELPLATHKPVVAIAPGSVWATKRWLEEYFVETATQLQNKGYTVVLIGGNDDAARCGTIARLSNSISLAGEFSLPQTASLLTQCHALLTNDSAPTHIAGLVGCKTITIFGSTIPEFGFAPCGESDIVLENKELQCRPCGLHGKKECPLGTMECMKSITPEIVLSNFEQLN